MGFPRTNEPGRRSIACRLSAIAWHSLPVTSYRRSVLLRNRRAPGVSARPAVSGETGRSGQHSPGSRSLIVVSDVTAGRLVSPPSVSCARPGADRRFRWPPGELESRRRRRPGKQGVFCWVPAPMCCTCAKLVCRAASGRRLNKHTAQQTMRACVCRASTCTSICLCQRIYCLLLLENTQTLVLSSVACS